MALVLTHTFVCGVADDGTPTGGVQPSHWNAALTTSMATSRVLGRTTAATGAIEELGISGSGSVAFTNSPTFVTPVLGVAASTTVSFAGATSGTTTVAATAIAGTTTLTLPAVTDTLAVKGANTFTATQTITEAVGSSALVLTGATQTTSFPVINATQTWNASGVTFTGWKLNVTNTASAAQSAVLDLQVGGSSVFAVRKDGVIKTPGNIWIDGASSGNQLFFNVSGGGTRAALANVGGTSGSAWCDVRVAANGGFVFSNTAGDASQNGHAFITSSAAATIQQGLANAASPIAQTLQAQGSRSGTDSNVAGASYTIRSGAGTGTATPSTLILQSYVAVASGTGAQTATTGWTIDRGTAVSVGYAVASLPAGAATGSRAHVTDSNATSYTLGIGAVVAGGGTTIVPVFYDGTNWRIG